MGLPRGLYEQLITMRLEAELAELQTSLMAERVRLHPAEAADRLAFHLQTILGRAISQLEEQERVEVGLAVARHLIGEAAKLCGYDELAREAPAESGELLRAVVRRHPDGRAERIRSPLTALLDTTLLTNAPGEPAVGKQLISEIESSDRIDVVMAFVRASGIRPLLDALSRHCEAGRPLRFLTTTYTGSTEGAALRALAEIGAQVRVSYDLTTTRLHAKAWLFGRSGGISTAYIGSSNLTHSAQHVGLEWNVRISGARNPAVIDKVTAAFETYWNSGEFVPYEPEEFERQRARASGTREGAASLVYLPPTDLRLDPFQERLLEQIELSRRRGYHRNLLVAATGTGKTVMAAVDYARLRRKMKRARLLFVAHRREILHQSLGTFRHALRDAAFGELWVDGQRPNAHEHVFASIQSIAAAGVEHTPPEHFDVVIVDEFHHAAAPSYEALLERVRPVELLGLTATPERADGESILTWFGDRIAAELRLWDAIDHQRLVPFAYYGIHDGTDLSKVSWRRGGYDARELETLYTADDVWARKILQALEKRADPTTMRALGFCVSVAHARLMARVFDDLGIPARAVSAQTPHHDREAALRELAAGDIRIVFSVDLFNEGVDVPHVDTLLLLRPTDSATVFLQQLGRGLRRAEGKTVCTVLDFVGHHRKEFRFDHKLRALVGGTRREIQKQVENDFPYLPAGCHLELDRVAKEVVLDNLKNALPTKWPARVRELRTLAATVGGDVDLARFLNETGLDVEDMYAANRCWSDLREAAGLPVKASGPAEPSLRKALGRLLHIDDQARIAAYTDWLARDEPPDSAALGDRARRLAHMLAASLGGRELRKDMTLADALRFVWSHPQVRAELRELLEIQRRNIDHLQEPLGTHAVVPLQVHARYTRIEILAAFGSAKVRLDKAWQHGVYWHEASNSDLLAFTLDKTEGHFSPTTRYRDYAISPELIHWETQARVGEETADRYIHHAQRGSHVMLFARLRRSERAFWFLGPARYVSHEPGQPMKITWRLHHPLSGDLFAEFAAVAG